MKPTHAEAFAEIVRLFASFAGHPPAHQEEQWPPVDAYIQHLATTGWTRREILALVDSMDASNTDFPSEECLEAAGEYFSCLAGDVHANCIVRLPGEPEDIDELTAYVRGAEWLKQ